MRTPSRPCRPRRLPRTLATSVGAALLATAATACAGGGDQAAGSSSGAKTLALSILGTPNSFAPTQLVRGQQAYVWKAIYDTLLIEDNNGQIKPGAAESWKYSDGARTLTLKLRGGMKFSSGAAVDASAVKATLDLMVKTPGPNQGSLASVASVEAPDASTVVIKLRQPDGSLLSSLSSASGVVGDPKTMTDKSAALNPVGSGPYTLDKAQTVNGSVYVLKQRDDYWDKGAYPFQTVKLRVISDPTAAANALKAGESNAGSVDASRLSQLESSGFKVTKVGATAGANLVLADRAGTKLKALGDVRVRKAINMAFDRDKLVQQMLRGGGVSTEQVFKPKGQVYDQALNKTYAYDTKAAKQLLAEAGYPNGFSVKMPSFIYIKQFEPIIQQALGDIGVKVTWEPVPPQQSGTALLSGKYPMFLIMDGLDADPVIAKAFYGEDGYRNPFHTTDPKLTDLLAQADRQTDPVKAAAAYRKVNEFGVEQAWTAPLFFVGTQWVTGKGITYLGDGSSTAATIRQFGVAK
ncbi:ABC transporter substrate-binding protein [Streptomyces sp. NPDC012616]|uniref:ABC transporter substrate-binding protein n=1 Tax=Streptomyces sp. NPDC012616 TaxID=3364840 RepID=UPI0036E457F1